MVWAHLTFWLQRTQNHYKNWLYPLNRGCICIGGVWSPKKQWMETVGAELLRFLAFLKEFGEQVSTAFYPRANFSLESPSSKFLTLLLHHQNLLVWFSFNFSQDVVFLFFLRRFYSVCWNIPEATQRQREQGWVPWSNRTTGRCNERKCQNSLHVCKSLSDAEGPQQWLSHVFPYPLARARGKPMQNSQSMHSS